MKNTGFRFGIVAAVVALTVWLLVPSIQFYSKSEAEQESIRMNDPASLKRILNLGLDLQGGMRLVLEIDRSRLDSDDRDVLDRAYAIIENRINQLGVAEPSLQKQGSNRIIVELPGIKDERMAKEVIGKTAQLEFNLVRDDAIRERAFTVIETAVTGSRSVESESDKEEQTAESAEEQVRERAEQELADRLITGSGGDAAEPAAGDGDAADPLAPAGSFRTLIEYMGDMAVVRTSNVTRVSEFLRRDDVRRALAGAGLGGNVFLWGSENYTPERNSSVTYKYLYYLKAAPEMKGDVIKNAMASIDQSGGMNAGKAKVDMEMNASGARRFTAVTSANINRQLAIVLDSTVYSAPRIVSRIAGGRAEITGSFTMEEARALAIILRAGALPAPVNIIEERTVGPSLGQDAINKGIQATIIGTALIIVFMIIYYRLSGIIVLIALALNMAIVLATMAAFNATLTLPGIAGLILLIGMGTDANVLIFERIREELSQGRTVRSAIDQGYRNALSAIMDANLTTILTGFILMYWGTGPIRGFAVIMVIGIIASLFTALFVSKLLMDASFHKKAKISI